MACLRPEGTGFGLQKKIVTSFPDWSVALVDLRNHGDSCKNVPGPHTLHNCALDIRNLEHQLFKKPFDVVIGHSFGGKVGLEYLNHQAQVNRVESHSIRSRVWVLDTFPGRVGPHQLTSFEQQSVPQLIQVLKTIQFPKNASIKWLEERLRACGLSEVTAQWMTTNVRWDNANQTLTWRFDLSKMQEMFDDYCEQCMFSLLENPLPGAQIEYVRAERSPRWTQELLDRFAQIEKKTQHTRLHTLKDSGHSVHVDNPDGLFQLMSHTFRQ